MTIKSINKYYRGILVLFAVLGLSCSCTAAETNPSLRIEKNRYLAGEEIAVHFTAGPGFASSAWIGIIPSSIPHGSEAENDQHDLTYQYLNGKPGGTLIFKAPQKAGAYDFRMHNTDDSGKEVAHVSFQVNETGSTLKLDRTVFSPGEKIAVHFTAGPGFANNAWIGIVHTYVPHGSEAENDQHDLAYQYLGGKAKGTLIFNAPQKAGSYDFRMHDTDNDGREVASITFRVE
jgi:hypothetical protein